MTVGLPPPISGATGCIPHEARDDRHILHTASAVRLPTAGRATQVAPQQNLPDLASNASRSRSIHR